jgi:predicted nucleotide-binding protein
VADLQPGELWEDSITKALQSAIGILCLVSHRSLRSGWVLNEVAAVQRGSDRLIIPVLLEPPASLEQEMPVDLRRYQWLDISERSFSSFADAASRVVDAVAEYLRRGERRKPAIAAEELLSVAVERAQEVREAAAPQVEEPNPTSVFVVAGHNTEALSKLEKYLTAVGVTPVLLSRSEESPQSLFQRFMLVGAQARFAIVLLSSDDYGASRKQFEATGVGERALQFRARQNVILELGFFYGRLGWENVFVLYHEPDLVYPNFEFPSDLGGVVFDSMTDERWQQRLGKKLAAAKFELRPAP